VAEDGLLRLAGWALAATAMLLVATPALLVGALVYGVGTWRRWRWWPLAVTGATALLVVLAVSGPEGALNRHLLTVHDLAAAHRPLAVLVAHHWGAWALAQLPLAVPLGILMAAVGRHQVTHAP
jgi:hypothetical protein